MAREKVIKMSGEMDDKLGWSQGMGNHITCDSLC